MAHRDQVATRRVEILPDGAFAVIAATVTNPMRVSPNIGQDRSADRATHGRSSFANPCSRLTVTPAAC
jgi:hypothetical protein